jgi:hypothetical protein
MHRVTNTAVIPNFLAPILSGTGFIEEQEAQGQREAVKSESLPTPDTKVRAQYESLGVIFGVAVDGDPIFTHATLPKGWSLKPTDHNMHNNIVDAAGRVRGSFFYKAAFYDRKADLYAPNRRYLATKHYEANRARASDCYDDYKILDYDVVDTVDGTVIFSVKRTVDLLSPNKGGEHSAWWTKSEETERLTIAECKAWLDENYPDHENCAAYWDEKGDPG